MSLLSVAIFLFGLVAVSAKCPLPPINKNFTNQGFEGTWYEVGKIQTIGGAIFEHNCVCTRIIVNFEKNGTATVSNQCNDKTPQGKLLIENGTLTPTTTQSRFTETFHFGKFTNSVAYNVMYLTSDLAIEYDCGDNLFGLNYCFHVFSRDPKPISKPVADRLIQLAATDKLNPHDLRFKFTRQQGCSY